MSSFIDGFLSRTLRFTLKLLLGLFAGIFAISLLVAALLVVALNLLTSLITGRKLAPGMVFGQFQRFSPQGMWPSGPARKGSAKVSEVVDVEVREVHVEKHLP